MGFRKLNIKTEYRMPSDSIVQDFYIPVLKEAKGYDRAVGFFSSTSLAEITKGIADLVKNNGTIRIIASPCLSEDDINAINTGYESKEYVIENCLIRDMIEPENFFEEERLNLLANLIATGVLEIRIAVMGKESKFGIYHEKLGVINSIDGDIIAFTGSMNESVNAYYNNYESIDVYCSWTQDSERVEIKVNAFNSLWNNTDPNIDVIKFPSVDKKIIEKYKRNSDIILNIDINQFGRSKSNEIKRFISIPQGVTLKDYQKDAIRKWKENNYCGIFDMATGTGKTFTALGCLTEFENSFSNLCVFIVCPYIHLVNQWEEDALEWGVTPIISHSQAQDKQWPQNLINAYKRNRSTGKPFMCITTNDTFTSDKIQYVLNNISGETQCVLIVDEVHNFGASQLAKYLPDNIKYRLGLSATVERYMDINGTKTLYDYFGKKCIEYSLERAIREGALVEYEYYPLLVFLQQEELQKYKELTKELSRFIVKKNGKVSLTELGKQILFKRSRIVAGAENKLNLLERSLEKYKESKHILVYCGATRGLEEFPGQKERQIDRVDKLITKKIGMSAHRFTSEEDVKMRKLLKEGFADGEYQVLTAIKCLDEGVNIPNIEIAFIMASSRNPKEFIQRRGRVLRKSAGKDRAIIYDFVTLPQDLNNVTFGEFDEDKAIVMGELARIYEFGRYSINSRVADDLIEQIKESYCISIDNEDLNNVMEDAYGEE